MTEPAASSVPPSSVPPSSVAPTRAPRSAVAPPGVPRSGVRPAKGWAAVAAVSLAIFCLITSELLPVGLLTSVGADLRVSDGTAGLMVTVPGLVAGFCAPLVTVGAARLDRRQVLCALIGLMAAANLAAALAPGFAVVLAARLLVGISVGGFWAIAGGLAVRLVPAHRVGRATALIFGGVPTASVLGVPAGTLLGELGGWRTAFAAVGALGALTLAALLLLLPALPPATPVTFAELPALLRTDAGVRTGVTVTFLVVTGQFAAYTFVRPLLRDVSGVDTGLVSTLLLGYGLAGVAGNFLAGPRDPRRTLLTVSATLTVVLALTAVLPGPVAGTGLLMLWGLAYGGVSVSLQGWMLRAAPRAAEAASALMVAMFNFAIAAGALAGGLAVDRVSVPAAPLTGAALMLLAALTVTVHLRRGPNPNPNPGPGPGAEEGERMDGADRTRGLTGAAPDGQSPLKNDHLSRTSETPQMPIPVRSPLTPPAPGAGQAPAARRRRA
ncbi:putative MFS family arabinose efflux permease [Streptomyces sp. Ag109_G2-6]|uniref:MFS transporter n=1 Tax=Streptomyces TaxID=1883 RepID=UPI0009A54690|nr:MULTISPECIES: MFS transporter [Streptomyces]RPF29481.1 putative MFS family arabinose efflux permease [Streptomyces sp. Ag109_G2-6]